MAPNPKLYIRGKPYLITTRMEEGLPLIPHRIINAIVWSALSRALKLYNVTAVGFLFMANHFHFILIPTNPETVSGFIGHIKLELAHAVNRMLGRRKRTVWEEGYDSPILLTQYDVMRYLVYMYVNPVKADIEESIDKYPGVSSWGMMLNDDLTKTVNWIRRDNVPRLPETLKDSEDIQISRDLISDNPLEQKVTIEPFSWLNSYRDTRNIDPKVMKKKLIEMVRLEEQFLKKERLRSGKKVMGVVALKAQRLNMPYVPQKHSKKMICISSDIKLRIKFILWFRSLVNQAKDVYFRWLCGHDSNDFPPGMFFPGFGFKANWLPQEVAT